MEDLQRGDHDSVAALKTSLNSTMRRKASEAWVARIRSRTPRCLYSRASMLSQPRGALRSSLGSLGRKLWGRRSSGTGVERDVKGGVRHLDGPSPPSAEAEGWKCIYYVFMYPCRTLYIKRIPWRLGLMAVSPVPTDFFTVLHELFRAKHSEPIILLTLLSWYIIPRSSVCANEASITNRFIRRRPMFKSVVSCYQLGGQSLGAKIL